MIFSNLKEAGVFSIHRCYFENIRTGVIELHAFSDASESAYGACVHTFMNMKQELVAVLSL